MSRLLLISNSTVHGRGYLDHVEAEIRDFVGGRTRTVFVPYALHDRRASCAQAEGRLRKLGLEFTSVHDVSNASRQIEHSQIIFTGGGNTFRLLHEIQKNQLIEPIRHAVRSGALFKTCSTIAAIRVGVVPLLRNKARKISSMLF